MTPASRKPNNPSWAVEYVAGKKMVVATGAGGINDKDARAQSEKAIALLKDHCATLLLVDYLEAVSEMTFAVLYWLPRFYSDLGAPRWTRIAMVMPRAPYRLESLQFYALACRNAGYNVKLFQTREDAERWLQDGKEN